MPKLIVGLGNPGLEYEYTRHNIGWLLLDQLEDKLKFYLYYYFSLFGFNFVYLSCENDEMRVFINLAVT